MSHPSNDDGLARSMDRSPRPLARKKSSKSRFGLVQKYSDSETATVPSSSCSEILSALSREEREFVQGLCGSSPRAMRIDRRPAERPPRSSRVPSRRLMMRNAPLNQVRVNVRRTEGPVSEAIRNAWTWRSTFLIILAVFLVAVIIARMKTKEIQEDVFDFSVLNP